MTSAVGVRNGSTFAPGLWGVLATPFSADGREVDLASLRRLVDDQREAGAVGVVVLGVFGEASRLSLDEMLMVVRTVADCVPDLGILLGLGAAGADVGERASRLVEACGRPANIMLQIPALPIADMRARIEAVHRATGSSIVLQDYPALTGASTSTADLVVLAEMASVVAVKAEAPPTSDAIAAFSASSDVPIFGGLGGLGLLDELASGAHGVMTGFSHPTGLAEVLDGWATGGFDAAHRAIQPWLPLMVFEGQVEIGLAIRKRSLVCRGVIEHPTVRAPGRAFPERLAPLLEQHLRAIAERIRVSGPAASGT